MLARERHNTLLNVLLTPQMRQNALVIRSCLEYFLVCLGYAPLLVLAHIYVRTCWLRLLLCAQTAFAAVLVIVDNVASFNHVLQARLARGLLQDRVARRDAVQVDLVVPARTIDV